MRGSGGGSATRQAELRDGSPARGHGDLGHGGEGFGCDGTGTARRGSRWAVARRSSSPDLELRCRRWP
ncbi:vegetative cell wall protein gp1-like [Iris pallida]|uniref:Vegetative cell wall protein gp1-like n=1 Tax=Iris pallida TaxID=29817 RepID=A0AAX6FPM7_IRIPA|nr:vegetative cell wall protein gp1-like [Iris pallida]KAJ6818366.1 vegetative cell wall protein gp1-like [Iris pallida]